MTLRWILLWTLFGLYSSDIQGACSGWPSQNQINVATICRNSGVHGTEVYIESNIDETTPHYQTPCTCSVKSDGMFTTIDTKYEGHQGRDCGTFIEFISDETNNNFNVTCNDDIITKSTKRHSNFSVNFHKTKEPHCSKYCIKMAIKTCGVGEFQCNDGQCYPVEGKCNNFPDCADDSDEIDCAVLCPESEISCDNNKCIPKDKECDGIYDCSDKSDESEKRCGRRLYGSSETANSSIAREPSINVVCSEGKILPATTTTSYTTTSFEGSYTSSVTSNALTTTSSSSSASTKTTASNTFANTTTKENTTISKFPSTVTAQDSITNWSSAPPSTIYKYVTLFSSIHSTMSVAKTQQISSNAQVGTSTNITATKSASFNILSTQTATVLNTFSKISPTPTTTVAISSSSSAASPLTPNATLFNATILFTSPSIIAPSRKLFTDLSLSTQQISTSNFSVTITVSTVPINSMSTTPNLSSASAIQIYSIYSSVTTATAALSTTVSVSSTEMFASSTRISASSTRSSIYWETATMQNSDIYSSETIANIMPNTTASAFLDASIAQIPSLATTSTQSFSSAVLISVSLKSAASQLACPATTKEDIALISSSSTSIASIMKVQSSKSIIKTNHSELSTAKQRTTEAYSEINTAPANNTTKKIHENNDDFKLSTMMLQKESPKGPVSSTVVPFNQTSTVGGPALIGASVGSVMTLFSLPFLAWFAYKNEWFRRFTCLLDKKSQSYGMETPTPESMLTDMSVSSITPEPTGPTHLRNPDVNNENSANLSSVIINVSGTDNK